MVSDIFSLKDKEIRDLAISMLFIEHSILSPGPNWNPLGTQLLCISPSMLTPMSTNTPKDVTFDTAPDTICPDFNWSIDVKPVLKMGLEKPENKRNEKGKINEKGKRK